MALPLSCYSPDPSCGHPRQTGSPWREGTSPMWHLTQVLDIVGAHKVSKKGRRKMLWLSILMISPDLVHFSFCKAPILRGMQLYLIDIIWWKTKALLIFFSQMRKLSAEKSPARGKSTFPCCWSCLQPSKSRIPHIGNFWTQTARHLTAELSGYLISKTQNFKKIITISYFSGGCK